MVGSERKQLILQFLGESFVLSFFSFVFAMILAVAVLPFFNQVSGKALSFSYLLGGDLVLGYFALFLLTGFLAGFYPALVLSRFNPVETLYGKLRYSGKNYLSRGLVVLQFSLATVLIICTITIYAQFEFLSHYQLGYDKSNVLRLTAGKMNKSKLAALKNELLRDRSIKKVTAKQGGSYITIARVNGNTEKEFGYNLIDEANFEMFSIPLVKGRGFSPQFPADSSDAVLVNETFVKSAGWKNPIGEVIDFYYRNKKYHVIGVVKDFHTGPLTEKITPQVFTLNPEMSYEQVFLKIDPQQKTAALRHAEKTIRKFFPLLPYDYSFLEEDLLDQYKSEARWKKIIFFSAILSIFISCIGLLGLAVLQSERRAKEIGIRKVLGASVFLIVRKLSIDFVKLVILSAFIALPAGWWLMNRWLQDYPYRTQLNPFFFVLALLIVLFVALLTVSWQSLRAAVANPANSLRAE
jgi:putative ABC transport system permease protein